MDINSISWSQELPFEKQVVSKIPDQPGVYKILQNMEYSRYKGTTKILKIGKSEKSLRDEILNHFQRHTVANRLSRIKHKTNITITVEYSITSIENAGTFEKLLLKEFEDVHWDIPVLNSQRGYSRNEDSHYVF